MERPIEKYINEVMKKKEIRSYSQLSQKLEMNHNAIFNIMSKGGTPSDEFCKKLADLAGDPVEKVLLLAAESRAPESTRKAWEKIAKASGFLLLVALWWTGHLHADQTTLPLVGLGLSNIHYATYIVFDKTYDNTYFAWFYRQFCKMFNIAY